MAVFTAIAAAVTSVGAWLGASSIGALLVRTVVTGLISSVLTRTLSKNQSKTGVDPGARFQLSPQTNHKIPVLYGSAYFGGIIVDGQLVDNNKKMWMAMALSETTGRLFSDSTESAYTFEEAYLNSNRVTFKSDGITVDYTTDVDGNTDRSMSGLMRVRMYAGSGAAARQLQPPGTTITAVNAWSVFPGWTANHAMTDLISVIVDVDYNRDKNVTSVGEWQFKITNSMSRPGDVMFDYATNTRYGAGIPLTDIYFTEDRAALISRMSLDTYPWINLE